MSQWSTFYQSKMTELYRMKLTKKYDPFLRLIADTNAQSVGELGCGASNVTRTLIQKYGMGVRHFCFDLDKDMLHLSEKNLEGTSKVSLSIHNIKFEMKQKFDLIHSHGVLEHFDPHEIRQIVKNQLQSSDHLIHYVPSHKYGTGSFGDERLWTEKQWQDNCSPDKIVTFNDGYDYALIWKK